MCLEDWENSQAIPGTPRSHNATPAGSPATRGGMAVRGGRGGAPNAPSTPVRGHVSQKSMPEFGQCKLDSNFPIWMIPDSSLQHLKLVDGWTESQKLCWAIMNSLPLRNTP